MDVKTIVEKRVMCMENIYKDMLNSIIKGFEAYEIALYNNHGEFDYLNIKSQCINTAKILYESDKPINGIRYDFCYFMSIVQKLTGIRQFNEFMS